MGLTHPADFMAAATAAEGMLLQHEERLQELERLRPPHEALGNYQDVFNRLYEHLDDLRPHIVSVEDYVCMYLVVFQKMMQPIRVEQCWQVMTFCNKQEWRLLCKFMYHACRLHNRELVSFWRTNAPFPDEQIDETRSFSFTAESMPIPQMMQQMMGDPLGHDP